MDFKKSIWFLRNVISDFAVKDSRKCIANIYLLSGVRLYPRYPCELIPQVLIKIELSVRVGAFFFLPVKHGMHSTDYRASIVKCGKNLFVFLC